jgi:hypothetical protein
LSFFQENEIKILDDIKEKDTTDKLRNIEINEEGFGILKGELGKYINLILDKARDRNTYSQETISKLNLMEADNNPILENSMSGDKRRTVMYQKEAIISEWVETDEQLYVDQEFQYYDEVEIDNGVVQPQTAIQQCRPNNGFCLYCNFFKVFDIPK